MSVSITPFFTPTSVTGCQLWLDGADPAGTGVLPSNGATVSTWVDKSGNANNATGGTSPTYSTARQGLVFSTSASTYLQTSITAVPSTESIFCVFTPTSAALSANLSLNNDIFASSTTYGLGFQIIGNGTNFLLKYDIWGINGYAPTGYTIVPETRTLGSGTFSNPTATVYLSGGSSVGGPASTGGYPSGSGTRRVGSGAGGDYFNGTIHELIYFNVVLATSQRQQVESYLAQKWGLTSSLPSGHPGLTTISYRSSIPTPLKVTPYSSVSFAFAPTQISGCSLWLDGSDSSTMFQNTAATTAITADGQTIGAWRDKSSNAYLFTQATTGNQPTYKVGILNGCSLTRWNGTSSGLQSSTTIPFYTSASSGGSFFFVFMITNNSSQHFLMTYQNQTYGTCCISESEIGCPTGNGDTGNFGIHQGCSKANVALSQITTNTYVLMNLNLLSSGTAPANTTIYKNGTSASITAQNGGFYSGTTYPYANNARYLNIGYRVLNGAYPIDCWLPGDIAEIVWYQNPVTDTQRQQVEAYLAQKWGLTSSLAATHPGLTTTYYLTQSILSRAAITTPAISAKIPINLSGLIIYYPFDNSLNDFYTLTSLSITGTYSYTTGKKNQCLSLTNTSGVAPTNYLSSSYVLPSIFTVSLWFQTPNTSVGSMIFCAASNVSLVTGSISIYFSSGYLGCAYSDIANNGLAYAISANTWYHAAITYNSGSMLLYVNGSLSGNTVTGTNSKSGFTLGGGRDSGTQYPFTGYIDDFRIYNRILTTTELTAIYNNLG